MNGEFKKPKEPFQVFIKPVGAICNLACDYCYYLNKQKHSPEQSTRMSPELLEKYIIQHIEATEGQEVFFSWHGGEPTLAGIPFFQQVVKLQKKYTPEGFSVINGIQTNGTLLDEDWCQFLKKENFIVGISLDGPEQFHSANRVRKDGESCFNEVMRGFQLLNTYEIPCEILCVVNAQNVGHPLEVYHFFKSLNAEFLTFIPLVEPTGNPEFPVSKRSLQPKDFGEFLVAVFEEWKANDIGQIKIQIFEEALRTAFGLEHSLCIFKPTCGNVPVVERNGDFYSCDHFVDQNHLVGNILKTSLADLLESPKQKNFGQNKLTKLPDFCRKCEVLSMCNGACPKDRFIFTPDGESGLNYLCEGYKLFFRHCKPFVDQVAAVWKSQQ